MALAYQRHALELEALLANMSDALVTVDARGAIVRLNRQARELLGLDGASLVLGQALDLQRLAHLPETAREIAAALMPIIDSVRAGTNVAERDIELTAGQRRTLSVSAAILRTPGTPPQGGVIVFRDVTSQRELERLREDVFAMAWHDMHTPITVIRGHAALLLARVRHGRTDKKSFVNAAELIVKHSDRLADLLTALFDIRCLQAGMLKLSRWPTDLGLLARELVDGLRATSRQTLIIDASDGIVGECDERRIRQVLMNLLSNAAKYSAEGSTISVSVRADGDWATVSVRDEGIGLEADEIAQLFHRGYRATRALNVRGGGLGLYLAHGLISAHGGRMWAESPGHDRGSTFSFALPIGTREGDTGTAS
jgi:PAS domain S-box-containing protein